MNIFQYLKIVRSKVSGIVFVVLLLVCLSLVAVLVQLPFKYRSGVQLLVIETQDNLDAYSAIRSAEKVSNSLAHIAYTTSFMDKVLASGNGVKDDFPRDPVKRQKEWEETVDAYVVRDTGMLKINVYRSDRNQAIILAGNITQVLSYDSREYTGSENIVVKTVDQPITTKYPVKPNLLLNLAAAAVLGLVLAVGYVLLTASEQDLALAEAKQESNKATRQYGGQEKKAVHNHSLGLGAVLAGRENKETEELAIPVVTEKLETAPAEIAAVSEPLAAIAEKKDNKSVYQMLKEEGIVE